MLSPISNPGRIPAAKRYPTEASETMAYITIGSDGGMIGPTVAVAAVMAAAYDCV